MTYFSKKYMYNAFFLFGMLLLVLNDQIFKWEFANTLTGKLSDLAGVFVLPFFLSFFFPKHLVRNLLVTGLFFVFWKLPISEGFIQTYNEFAFIPITRVVDLTDLWALFMLPISYVCLKHVEQFQIRLKLNPVLLLLPCCLIFMATSWPKEFNYTRSNGNVKFVQSYEIDRTSEAILATMQNNGLKIKRDDALISEVYNISSTKIDRKFKEDFSYYIINEMVIANDTLHKLQFAIRDAEEAGSILYLNSITVQSGLSDAEAKTKLQDYYRELLKTYFSRIFGLEEE